MDEDAIRKINQDDRTKNLYSQLLEVLNNIGKYEVEVKKNSLHITNNRAFLGVHPRKSSLLLNIVTDQPLANSRLKKVEKVSANRFHNEIIVQSADDFDGVLISWLKQAYALTVSS